MSARKLDGVATAAAIRAELVPEVQAFKSAAGRAPSLHILLIGDDPGSQVYVRNKEKAGRDLSKVAVVPNPYVGAASWEPQSTSVGRGERRIFFIHLPKKCTIRIYTISGQFVQTIDHDGDIDDGQESWNLVSRDGMDIAFGMYVFHVETPDIGSIVGKFAVIK